MPQEQNSTPSHPPLNTKRDSYEKWAPEIRTDEELREVVDIAFDYRGDVTVTTKSGESIVGYIFNRVPDAAEPYIECYPKGDETPRTLKYREIAGIVFTGIDSAAGRSWENWIKKNEEKKKALAEGRDIGDIEPKPMPLDNE
ncbi:MAG: hypothetical protein KIS92_10920 [Planctomycetota bacterium]|nr:hypothetical protein [Planctomycetota bacterium]